MPAEVAQQAMVVKRAQRIDIECIVRGYITGSAWGEYRRQGTVSGHGMPTGMVEGQPFPEPLFTPTTKAEEGHDENMSRQAGRGHGGRRNGRQAGRDQQGRLRLRRGICPASRGIILADTKMEFGILDGQS